MKKIILWVIALFFSSLSLAQSLPVNESQSVAINQQQFVIGHEAIPFNQHQGWYAEINIGTTAYYAGLLSTVGEGGGAGVIGTAWGAAVGYQFTKTFGLEGGMIQAFDKINSDNLINVPYMTTRFSYPFNDRWSLIGKLGLMFPYVLHQGGILSPYSGIGVSYAATQRVDISLQYQGLVLGVAGVGALSLGLTYHF